VTKIFVAGATGFTGRAMATLALDDADLTLQVRSERRARTVFPGDDRARVVDVDDAEHLASALEGQDAVIQLIGTVRKRFDAQTSYETVDYGTTVSLLEAAERAGVPHFVLVSSAGAGAGVGSYLKWKKKTEAVVERGAVPWTIVRPGIIAGDEGFLERPKLEVLGAFLNGVSNTPVNLGAANWRPMRVKLLARLLVEVTQEPARTDVVNGRQLWKIARRLGLR
jgi:uncharacterized protein YbjT (DUF2867 family)